MSELILTCLSVSPSWVTWYCIEVSLFFKASFDKSRPQPEVPQHAIVLNVPKIKLNIKSTWMSQTNCQSNFPYIRWLIWINSVKRLNIILPDNFRFMMIFVLYRKYRLLRPKSKKLLNIECYTGWLLQIGIVTGNSVRPQY